MTLSPASSVRGGYPLGLAGATAATRYVGATATGAPASGTFAVGDYAITQDGSVYICTVAGTPGTWAAVSGGGGTAVDPVQEIFGTPDTAFEFETSSLVGLTALGTPTTVNADTTIPSNYYIRQAAAAGVSWKGHYLAQAVPFTAVVKLTDISGRDQWNYAAMFVSEAAPGALTTVGIRFGAEFASRIYHVNWNSPTGSDQGGGKESPGPWQCPLYFAIVANSSDDVDTYYSYDGYLWLPLVVSYNPAWTVAAVGIGVNCETASWSVAAAFDYLRIWASAKTILGPA